MESATTTSGIPPMVPSTDAPRRRRSSAVIAAFGVVLLVALGVVLVVRGRGSDGATDSESIRLMRLPTDPGERRTIKPGPSVEIYGATGSPDRVVLLMDADGTDQIATFDGDGTELWRRDLGDDIWIDPVGTNLLVGNGAQEGPLTLLDLDTGDELWSTVVPRFFEFEAVGETLLLYHSVVSADFSLTAYDLKTGDKIGERRLQSAFRIRSALSNTAVFIVSENEKVFVVDERLENVTTPIPRQAVGSFTSVGFMDEELLVANDGELISYGLDGVERAAASVDLESVNLLLGVADSTWLYVTLDDMCGAFEFSAGRVEMLWELEDCGSALLVPWVLANVQDDASGGRDPYAIVDLFDAGESVIDPTTGEVLVSAPDDDLELYANGVLQSGSSETAYAIPSGEELFSVQPNENQRFNRLDNGYLIIEERDDETVVIVYG